MDRAKSITNELRRERRSGDAKLEGFDDADLVAVRVDRRLGIRHLNVD